MIGLEKDYPAGMESINLEMAKNLIQLQMQNSRRIR